MGEWTKVGGPPPMSDGPITLEIQESGEVKAHENAALKSCFGRFICDQVSVRDKLDGYLREIVAERFDMLDLGKKLEQMVERRVEIAVKEVEATMKTELAVAAREQARKRLVETINALPILVNVEVG